MLPLADSKPFMTGKEKTVRKGNGNFGEKQQEQDFNYNIHT